MIPHNEFDPNDPQASHLGDEDVAKNMDYTRRDEGGLITNHNGMADALLKNDAIYKEYKGDWQHTSWNKGHNIKTTTGRKDGKFYITREQMNVQATADRCRRYREAAEQGIPDPLAPIGDDGKLAHKWMELPHIFEQKISDDYFGGMRWSTIKHDRTLKAQFYRVVQEEYPMFICYPGGKLPIPIDVPYPAKKGERKFF